MRKFEWCLERGESGKKHRGLRKTEPDSAEADRHIAKALHNLDVMAALHTQGFDDWTLSAAFYAMYHSSLAVLYELGYESRNQECTFTALEHLIGEKVIDLDKETVWIMRRTGESVEALDAKTLRETFQYGVETEVNPVLVDETMGNARLIVQKMRIVLEKLRQISEVADI